jgi:L-lactate utilization protein LutC
MPVVTTTSSKRTSFAEIVSEPEIEAAKKALEAKGFTVEIADNLLEAKQKVLNIIPKDTEVFTATSVTLDKSALTEELNSTKYQSIRNKFMALYGQEDKQVEMRRIGSASDYAVGSVHAITQEGDVMVASATGSQLPNYAYGATKVIWVVGAQKIVKDLNEAFERLENYTFPLENERAKKAYGVGSSINKVLLYRNDPTNRATIIFVKEPIGF